AADVRGMGIGEFRTTHRVKSVVKPELGTKRTCPNCSARFYDLEKDPIVCPKCSYAFVAEALLPSKMEQAVAVAPAAKTVVETDDEELDDADLVSLDDIEGEDKDEDDEVPAIEDVEIADDDVGKDDDTFLEDDDEEGPDVAGIIGVSDDDDEN